ncbi:MAG TPA: FHA domain-containing protein [Kofleriaceae bacterium]|nr:FHA domain-containing protein [Kofleriaceae bacterium]
MIGGALLVLAARPSVAPADDSGPATYRAVIDRVDLEPASIGDLRLRVELSALALQGQQLDLTDPKSIRLTIGGGKLEAPFALGTYGATNADTALVIVLEANLAYAETLPNILSTLDDIVLSALGDRTQLAILTYGEATGTGKLGTLKSGRSRLSQASQDGSAGEPALLDTLDRALLLLKRAKTTPEGRPLRKLVVAIGDGRDRSGDRERVTALGVRADKQGVRIHTLGYAPSNVRRPLLTLGELSRRSQGTFRWVRAGGTESWSGAFQQLRDEITKQYVLTYFLPPDAEVAGKKLKIVTVGRTEATSNELRIPEPACGRDPCAGYCVDAVCVIRQGGGSRGPLGWLLLIGGVLVGVVVLLGLIGFVLQKRQGAAPPMPGPFPQGPPVPGQLPIPPPKGRKEKKVKPPKNQPLQPPAPAPITGPSLLVMTGPRTGERIPLLNGFTIGKAPNSNLVLDDGYTSSQHAQVGIDHMGNCRLYDRNSTNGTFANGVRVSEVVLDHGMSVRIGSTELRFLAQ